MGAFVMCLYRAQISPLRLAKALHQSRREQVEAGTGRVEMQPTNRQPPGPEETPRDTISRADLPWWRVHGLRRTCLLSCNRPVVRPVLLLFCTCFREPGSQAPTLVKLLIFQRKSPAKNFMNGYRAQPKIKETGQQPHKAAETGSQVTASTATPKPLSFLIFTFRVTRHNLRVPLRFSALPLLSALEKGPFLRL